MFLKATSCYVGEACELTATRLSCTLLGTHHKKPFSLLDDVSDACAATSFVAFETICCTQDTVKKYFIQINDLKNQNLDHRGLLRQLQKHR